MSHHHDDHGHHHAHDHDHHHRHEIQSSLSFEEKLVKILEHWVRHNDDHAETYRSWAQRANAEKFSEVRELLEGAADMTAAISKKFEAAANLVKNK
ncbi:MAG: hypothetical protein BWK80_54430 [Desulfobacteraceae bacterium IS3]|nr:MAG: hypothetical protein BWK80_54430 [Desulfobacteraceae bacterium IS3]